MTVGLFLTASTRSPIKMHTETLRIDTSFSLFKYKYIYIRAVFGVKIEEEARKSSNSKKDFNLF